MYVIDITRDNSITDMLCGNNSMDAKNKTLDYVIDYAFANCNIIIDKDLLDQNLDISLFSLNKFLNENYLISIDKDLIIQSMVVDKDNCLFVKYKDDNNDVPILYSFNKDKIGMARDVLTYLVNDGLINKYQDDLSEYEKRKLNYNHNNIGITLDKENIKCEIISLYDYKGMFLEELLSNAWSLNSIKNINNYDVNL